MSAALAILDEAEARLAPLSVATNLAWWDSQVAATEENAERRTQAELAWSGALADRELFARVLAARSGAEGEAGRQLDLLHDLMLTHQLPDELRARIVELESSVDLRFSRHRGLVGGVEIGDTEIKRILRQSDDPAERREAWEASKTVGAEVADDVRALARLRNEAARALGHRDWFALSLSTDELDEQKLIDTLGEADRVTAAPFARWKSALDESL
ncbi:MAG TPA: M2 family metallopeptidase, partial [Gaiellaceae bacterium]